MSKEPLMIQACVVHEVLGGIYERIEQRMSDCLEAAAAERADSDGDVCRAHAEATAASELRIILQEVGQRLSDVRWGRENMGDTK